MAPAASSGAMPSAGAPAATLAPAATPPAPAVDPTPPRLRGPINADGVEFCWQNGRDTEDVRAAWAAGARGAKHRCPDCTAPLVWDQSTGGELVCWGCRYSSLPLRWRCLVVKLWLTGAKASAIAEATGSTKSAVLSYRRRARLPPRGSPLIGCGNSERTQRKRRRAERIAKLPAAAPRPRPERRVAKVPGSPTGKPAAPSGAAAAETRRPNGPLPRHRARSGFATCQYIVGRATFCDDAVAAMSPYCEAHTRLCFQPSKQVWTA